jgi:hypothetical protein
MYARVCARARGQVAQVLLEFKADANMQARHAYTLAPHTHEGWGDCAGTEDMLPCPLPHIMHTRYRPHHAHAI